VADPILLVNNSPPPKHPLDHFAITATDWIVHPLTSLNVGRMRQLVLVATIIVSIHSSSMAVYTSIRVVSDLMT
jgi:hypothetical protein